MLLPTKTAEERKDKEEGRGRRVWRATEGKGRTHCCSRKAKPKVLAGVDVEGRSAVKGYNGMALLRG